MQCNAKNHNKEVSVLFIRPRFWEHDAGGCSERTKAMRDCRGSKGQTSWRVTLAGGWDSRYQQERFPTRNKTRMNTPLNQVCVCANARWPAWWHGEETLFFLWQPLTLASCLTQKKKKKWCWHPNHKNIYLQSVWRSSGGTDRSTLPEQYYNNNISKICTDWFSL